MNTQLSPLPRVLILTSTYPRWPNDTLPPFVHELARRLTDKFEMHVLAPHAPGAKSRERLDDVEIHRFHYLPERFETLAYTGGILPGLRKRPWRFLVLPLFLLSQFIVTLRLIRCYHFDVIHAHWVLPQGFIAVLARHLSNTHARILCTGHGTDIYALNSIFGNWFKRYTLSRVDKITVPSQSSLRAIKKITIVDDRYSVLSMGVDIQNLFIPNEELRNPKAILYVGRLTAQKGVKYLLEAFKNLEPRLGLHLRIIGNGPEYQSLVNQASDMPTGKSIEFLGAISNEKLPYWYQTSSILVFPSVATIHGEQEGFGLVPVEALGCRCAVIASDLPAVREIIHDGVTGILVAPNDSNALTESINTLINDPALRDRLAISGRIFVENRFDWMVIARQYATLLEQLITKNTTKA